MTLLNEIVKLTGQPVPHEYFKNYQQLKDSMEACDPFNDEGIGYSQFNELLLTLGYDRVTKDFFVWLFEQQSVIYNIEILQQAVTKFRTQAIHLYGDVKYAFKLLSQMENSNLEKEIKTILPLEESHYKKRHEPLHYIENIPSGKAYLLGYIVKKNLEEELKNNSQDQKLKELKVEMEKYCQIGTKNHNAYLVSDHMDIYIATSMRERFEFLQVSHFVKELFQSHLLKPLKLRYFDPTQAYCKDRIDKGLVEGLMLKRARCTIYHIQESDTFGKDSELAATLAQGKPVIAFIPTVPNLELFENETLEQISQSDSDQPVIDSLLSRLKRYYPEAAWTDSTVKHWLQSESKPDVSSVLKLLHTKVTEMYDKRAKVLKEDHPLGLQVNLSTGVANGVLVVREVSDCARLLRRVLLNRMEFEIQEKDNYIYLKENISQCTYRVTTGDRFLINAFWNFYLKEF